MWYDLMIGHGAESYVVRNSRVKFVEGRPAMNCWLSKSLRGHELDDLALGPASVVRGVAVSHA